MMFEKARATEMLFQREVLDRATKGATEPARKRDAVLAGNVGARRGRPRSSHCMVPDSRRQGCMKIA